jgi:hypothetical protein
MLPLIRDRRPFRIMLVVAAGRSFGHARHDSREITVKLDDPGHHAIPFGFKAGTGRLRGHSFTPEK